MVLRRSVGSREHGGEEAGALRRCTALPRRQVVILGAEWRDRTGLRVIL